MVLGYPHSSQRKTHFDLRSFIRDFLVGLACNLLPNPMSCPNHHDPECVLFHHSGEVSFPSLDGQYTGTLVPANWNHRMLTLLIVVAVPCILIKIECAVRSTVDAELDGSSWILRSVFN